MSEELSGFLKRRIKKNRVSLDGEIEVDLPAGEKMSNDMVAISRGRYDLLLDLGRITAERDHLQAVIAEAENNSTWWLCLEQTQSDLLGARNHIKSTRDHLREALDKAKEQ